MDTRGLRTALWLAASFNLGAGFLFAFASSLGQWVDLPAPVPRAYGVFIAMFVWLFAGAYAWMASHSSVNAPMLTLAALGKGAAVVLAIVFYALGDVGPRALVAASGDLLFAAIFARWLWRYRSASAS